MKDLAMLPQRGKRTIKIETTEGKYACVVTCEPSFVELARAINRSGIGIKISGGGV